MRLDAVNGSFLLVILACIASAQIDTKSSSTKDIQERIFNDTSQSAANTQCKIKFTKYKKSYLRYVRVPDHLEYRTTFQGCLKKCCYERRFQCKSFSFVRLTRQCFLMNVTQHSNDIVLAFSEIHVHVEVMDDRDSTNQLENAKVNKTQANESSDTSNFALSTSTTKTPLGTTISSSPVSIASRDTYSNLSEISLSATATQNYENTSILKTAESTSAPQSEENTELLTKARSYVESKITGYSTTSTTKSTETRHEHQLPGTTTTKLTKFIYIATTAQPFTEKENLKVTTKLTSKATTPTASTVTYKAMNSAMSSSTTPNLPKEPDAQPEAITTQLFKETEKPNTFTESRPKITSEATTPTASVVIFEAINATTATSTAPDLPNKSNAEPQSSPRLTISSKQATAYIFETSNPTTSLKPTSKLTSLVTTALKPPTNFKPKAKTEPVIPTRPATTPKHVTTMKRGGTTKFQQTVPSDKTKRTNEPTTLNSISASGSSEESTKESVTMSVQKSTLEPFSADSMKTNATLTSMNPTIRSGMQSNSVITTRQTTTATYVTKPTEATKSIAVTFKSPPKSSTMRSPLAIPFGTTSKTKPITKSPEASPSTKIKAIPTSETSKLTTSVSPKLLESKRAFMGTTQTDTDNQATALDEVPGSSDTLKPSATSQEPTPKNMTNKSIGTSREMQPTRLIAEKYPSKNTKPAAVEIRRPTEVSSVSCLKQCENEGVCQKEESNDAVCVCKVGFSGESCELKIGAAGTMEHWRIILISLAGIILIIFVGYIILYIAYRKRVLGKYDVAKRFRNRPYGTDGLEEFSEARGASHSSLYWHDSMTMSSSYSASGSV